MAFVPPDLEVLTRKLRAGEPESPEDALTRFTVELEFVQALANPLYLGYLASSTLLDDPALVAYLEYLQYWKRPEYASRLLFPQCLFFLDMLQQAEFREGLRYQHNIAFLRDQQLMHWQHGFNRDRPFTHGDIPIIAPGGSAVAPAGDASAPPAPAPTAAPPAASAP